MHNRRHVFRWLVVVPAAVASWYFVFVVGILTHGFVEQALCPVGEMVSGMCLDRRVQLVLRILVHVFVGLSAAAVVLTAAAVAPTRRIETALITFAVGSVVAVAFGIAAWAYSETVAAVTSGLLSAMMISRNRGASPPPAPAPGTNP